MALEVGGRADKEGNQYENYFLGKHLLRLAEEKYKSVEVEPLGDEGQGVEYIVVQLDGTRVYYQCKAANAAKSCWSIADLARHKVFENAKAHIQKSPNNEFHFISPLSYNALNDLCTRARRNHSAEDFINHQVTNDPLRNALKACETQFGLSRSDPAELEQLVYILSKCHFEQVIYTQEAIQDAENLIGWFFCGDAKTARMLLENYANDQGKYGIELSPHDIISFMQQHGHSLRDYGKDESVWQRIQILNDTHWEKYSPINGMLLPRTAASFAVEQLLSGTSVVLHGRAGSGKSGCVEIVSNYLRDNNVLFLRLKLDKSIPRNTSTQYGQDLGLPDSPVRCLQKIAGRKECVLILDQLDALRWTSTHSPTAFAVCKELISEVQIANKEHGAKISIMFVTRSFDYKSDARIKELFSSDKQTAVWKEIAVDLLSDAEVEAVVGKQYAPLAQKVKEILRTPASLYVWMQLDEARHRQVITSANQLLYQWWTQILERCDLRGIDRTEVDQFIQGIAQQMSNTGSFSLLRKSFVAKEPIIAVLVSEGLLVDNASKIAFMHQTYLDYFVVNGYLNQVLNGTLVTDIIGDRDQQVPNLRYRFLVLLQELCEYDETIFVKQCKLILDSDNVRHYYKCTVFDAAAQQSDPGNELCKFVETYWDEPVWHEYVRQVVYWGNYPYIKHLIESGKIDCLSDEGVWLLRSINEKEPDFLVALLRPRCFTNEETDRKVFSCLCFDVDDDSDSMYQLRLELMKKHPALVANTWTNYYDLFKKGSPRVIDYMLQILESSKTVTLSSIHFPDRKELKDYAKQNYRIIVDKVVPQLCQVTAGMASKVDELWYKDEYTCWNGKEHNEGVLRRIVQIAKIAICEFAEQKPEEMLSGMIFEEYSEALIGNELILAGIEKLPIQFADVVVDWIMEAFPKHIFDYTGSKVDYLAVTKRILQKFTPHCSKKHFAQLEQRIFKWSEPSERMISIFRHRMETSKTWPVYYAYWGFMQKELLPVLDQVRLSVAAKDLLAVLNRNEWIRTPNYKYPVSGGAAKWVTSPISGYTDKISDKTWLSIVQTPPEKMSRHHGRETKDAYIEATPMEFAASFGSQAKKEPRRFAELALRFPDNCYSGYVSHALQAQEKYEKTDEFAGVELTSRLIRKFSQTDNAEILGRIADVVQSRAKEDWPEDILHIIRQIALLPVSKSSASYSNDGEKSAHSLYTEIYNIPQGRAIRAITSLIFAKPERFLTFKEAISTLAKTSEPFVLLALTDCAVACYNADVDFSLAVFRELVSKDARLLIANHAWQIIGRDYESVPDFYRERIIAALDTEYADLGEHAASMLCAVAIFYNDADTQKYILESSFTDKQANSICKQAAKCFDREEYREISKQIILRMVQEHDWEFLALNTNFFKENIVINRDKEFLLQLIGANSKTRMLVTILKFLCDTDDNIIDFAEVIYAVVKQAAVLADEGPMRVGVDEMVRCVAHLYDVGKDDPRIKTICLDTWDELFKNNLRDIQSLAKMLDNFN